MSGFAGFAGFNESLWEERYLWGSLGKRMGKRLSHRGPDENGTHVSQNCVFSQVRLALSDPLFGRQPLKAQRNGQDYTIAYNGELYNGAQLREQLQQKGHSFDTVCDAEVALHAYMEYGDKAPGYLNGMFAFAVDDGEHNCLFLCRDRFGIKPLFYTFFAGRIIFGSEIKAIFEYPGIKPTVDAQGLKALFALGPSRPGGSGIFKDIYELKPGYTAIYSGQGFSCSQYYKLEGAPTGHSYSQTVARVRELLEDICEKQMSCDLPVCSILSGSLDSGIITALCGKKAKENGCVLCSYSMDYEDDRDFFAQNYPELCEQEYWAEISARQLETQHTSLNCGNNALFYSLYDAVIARDLPGMADSDSSLLYFCREIKRSHRAVIAPDCSDLVLGSYPWLNSPMEQGRLPWSNSPFVSGDLLRPEIEMELDLKGYIGQFLESQPRAETAGMGLSPREQQYRQMLLLTTNCFMPALLERIDRCSMYSGLEIRLPYADHRLVEYLYSTPMEYKNRNGVGKSLLIDGAGDLLPKEILTRNSPPCRKPIDPRYLEMLKIKLNYILRDSLQPIHKLICSEKARELLRMDPGSMTPWFGGLMPGHQLLAYLIQLNYWLLRYNVYIV